MKFLTILLLLCGLFYDAFGQVNDDCKNAVVLTAGSQCSFMQFSNINATSEEISIAPDPTCGSFTGADVWFKTTMPASGGLRIEVDDPFSAVPPSFSMYSGSCGNFQELTCARNDDGKTINDVSLAGALVFIRVYSYFSEVGRPFNICVFEPEIPLNDQCENALLLQVEESCKPIQYSNKYSTAEPVVAPIPGCAQYRGGDIWFKVLMPASGVLRIDKERISGATHPEMVAYTGSCNNFNQVFCSSNDPTVTIDDPSISGEMLYLRIFSYGNEEGATFSLCLYEEDAPQNDNCRNAIILPVGDNCVQAGYTNRQATEEPASIAPVPACSSYRGGDVWFKVVVPVSGALQIEIESEYGTVPPSIAFYSGTCGSFSNVDCIENDNSFFVSEQTLAGDTLTLRVFSYYREDGANFFLCAFEPACVPSAIDAGETSICKGEVYQFGSQTISQAGQYTELFQSSTGCDSLVSVSVTVNNVDTSVMNNNGVLTAAAMGALYQWVDCVNGFKPVAGANNQTFQADVGTFAVIITQNACIDTSACYVASLIVGVEGDTNDVVSFFPNPSADNFYIDFHRAPASLSVEVVDMNGRTVKTENFKNQSLAEVDTRWLPSGAYVVRLQTENGITAMKLIKK